MRRSQKCIGLSLTHLVCGLTLCMLPRMQALEEGDACTLKDNLAGECRPTSSCEKTLLKYIKSGRLKINDVPSCGLGTLEEIICCPTVECCADATRPSQVTTVKPIASTPTSRGTGTVTTTEDNRLRDDFSSDLDDQSPFFDFQQILNNKTPRPNVPPKNQFEVNRNLPPVTHEAMREQPRSWDNKPFQSEGPLGTAPANDRQPRIINRPSSVEPMQRLPTRTPARGVQQPMDLIKQVNEHLRRRGMNIVQASEVSTFEEHKETHTTITTTARPIDEFDLDPWAPYRFRENNNEDVEQIGPTTSSTTTTEKTIEVTPTTRVDVGNKDRAAIRACRNIEDRTEINALTPHILDGVAVEAGVYPHMAAIALNTLGNIAFGCGGSLITSRHVLTAAHCVNDPNRDPVYVRLGTVNISIVDQNSQDINITSNIAIHPDYVSSSKYHDIAILELAEVARLSFYIYPACLSTDLADPPVQAGIFVAGWGVMDNISRKYSQVLLRAPLSIVPVPECNRTVQAEQPNNRRFLKDGVTNAMLCAQDRKNMKADSCQGDSGGPLMYERDIFDNKYSIVGVVSAGFGCATKTPGLYTRVASYLDYIESVVWPNNVV